MLEEIFDPMTGLMTPFHFYESAKRLKSWADRKGEPLSVIAIHVPEVSDDVFVECSRRISVELRGGDLLARMGDRILALILLGDETGAGHLIFRLSNSIKPKLSFEATAFQSDETLIDVLERLGI